MPKLSIISHFYNHPRMVEDQVAYWNTLPDELLQHLEFVVVDDCSEECPTLAPGRIDLRLFRVISELPWNQAGARNLGAFNATGEWAMYFDIDQRFYPEAMYSLILSLPQLKTDTMYYMRIKELIDITVNEPLPYHPNSFLVHLASFKRMGMYDEDFVGHYGYEDLYMPRVWERNGGNRILLDNLMMFEDMGFGTSNMNRDLSRNLALAQQKLAAGARNSTGMLRFDWEQIDLAQGYPNRN
jgi:glycosyltransferase involved in cell wall biosynthesis